MIIEELSRRNVPEEDRKYYLNALASAKAVSMTPIAEVFSEREMDKIMRCAKPEQRSCYKNSMRLASLFDGIRDIRYCEGYMLVCGTPVEHAFCFVDGRYVDPTVEIALSENPKDFEYAVFGEYTTEQVMAVLMATGHYGTVDQWYWNENNLL